MPIRRVHVEVQGRVQGVAYRAHTQERALALGLTGWVRNEPRDPGSPAGPTRVTLEVQGDAEAVDRLISWCRTGPAAARVDDLATTEVEPVTDDGEFRIARTPTRAGSSS